MNNHNAIYNNAPMNHPIRREIQQRGNLNHNVNDITIMSRDTYQMLSRFCDNDNPMFYIEPKELVRRLRQQGQHVDDNIISMLQEYVSDARGVYHTNEMYDNLKNEVRELFPHIQFFDEVVIN